MKKVLLALLITAFPAQVWAGGCGCGSVRAIVTAAKSETIQAVNAYTAAEAQAIRSEILLAAQNIIGTIKTESATIVRALIALKESNAATLKGQAVAGEAMKTEDMYGKAAQPAGRTLWSMIPECRIIVPKGVGIVPYEIPGTLALAHATIRQLEEHDVVFWEKHGILAVGEDLIECFDAIDTLSKSAQIYFSARMTGYEPEGMTEQQLDDLVPAFGL